MIQMTEMLEAAAPDERSKLDCGIMVRYLKIEQAIHKIQRFANPVGDNIPIEHKREAFEALNAAFETLDAFLGTHEVPET